MVKRGNRSWSTGVRVWLERVGRSVLGQGRADLLAAVERTGSISAAARLIGMSYRHAWLQIQAVNDAAGEPLVTAATGGQRGGGARLTPSGKEAIRIYRELHAVVRKEAAAALPRILGSDPGKDSVVHVAAAISLQEVVGQLLAEYALVAPTARVQTIFGGSHELAEQLRGGLQADIFITGNAELLAELESGGRCDGKSRSLLAGNGLALIAAEDSPLRIRNARELLSQSTGLVALAVAAAPLGRCSRAYLTRAGIYEKLRDRALQVDNSRAVLAAVRSGQAECGWAFTSDAATAGGCRILYAPPGAAGSATYVAVVMNDSAASDAARELLAFFASKAAQASFRRCGFTIPKMAKPGS